MENLAADINLNANVAGLVKVNAGVQVGISKVNITIADVDAELELVVRLGNLVEIVGRVFESLDLNPLLVNVINGVTDLLDDVVGVVDGLLGSITQGGKTLNFVRHTPLALHVVWFADPITSLSIISAISSRKSVELARSLAAMRKI